MNSIQQAQELYQYEQEFHLKKELKNLMQKEKEFWCQRSRVHWLTYGDMNTHFFHFVPLQGCTGTSSKGLYNDKDSFYTTDEDIGIRLLSHFQAQFNATFVDPSLLHNLTFKQLNST